MERYSYSWIKRLNIVKMVTLPKLICRFNAIPIRITAGFFVEIDKLILKFTWKYKGPKIAKATLKKNKVPNFKTSHSVAVIKTLT